jgi:hypothetical protein
MIKLTRNYPKLKILPKHIKNKKLLTNIDYVLTIYGSVGREYPIFGIPALNASNNGPHQAYKFCKNTFSIKHYKNLIFNIKKLKVNKKEIRKVYDYYTLRYLIDLYFFGLEQSMKMNKLLKLKKIDEYHFLKYWLENFKQEKHNYHLKIIEQFIESKQHRNYVNNLSQNKEFLNINN